MKYSMLNDDENQGHTAFLLKKSKGSMGSQTYLKCGSIMLPLIFFPPIEE